MDCKTLQDYQEQVGLRHDFVLSVPGTFSLEKVEALSGDLQKHGFRNVIHAKKAEISEQNPEQKKSMNDSNPPQGPKTESFLLFFSFDDEKAILQEAIKENCLLKTSAYDPKKLSEINEMAQKKKEKMGISRVIIRNEQRVEISEKHANEPYDLYKYLSEADRVRLSFRVLKRVRVVDCPTTLSAFKKDKIEDKELLVDYLNRHDIIKDIFCLKSRSQSVLRMLKFQEQGAAAAPSDGSIWKKASQNLFIDDETIREFYGEEVAIYFAWMNYFLKWIAVPAGFGLVFRTVNYFVFTDISKSPLNAAFSIMMAFWGILFSTNWKRNEHSLSVIWQCYSLSTGENHEEQEIRQEFQGELCYNAITEKMEPDIPRHKKLLKYLESFIILLPFFIFVIAYLIAAYNITGVITVDSKYQQFVIPSLASLAEPDALFDASTNMNFIPSIGQIVCTLLLNTLYREVATWCTDRENHKYQSEYENSLIVKRFIFEFFDCFLPLIYLGWWDLNFKVLRQTVISMYIVDEFRRVFLETVVPFLFQSQSSTKTTKQLSLLKLNQMKLKNEQKLQTVESEKQIVEIKKNMVLLEELEELEKDELEIFDDYMEMIMTFGYITMFASVFTLGATIIFIFILIETRSDIFKIDKTRRRPIPGKTHTIGSWSIIIDIFCFLSVFSNIIVSAYASDQIDGLFPWLKDLKENSETSLLTVFTLEHLLLFSVFSIQALLDRRPAWVEAFFARKAYRRAGQESQKEK